MPSSKLSSNPSPTPSAPTSPTPSAPKLPPNIVRVGNLTKEWDLAYSTAGKAYARSALAVNGWGERKGQTNFYNLVAFGTLAENLSASTTRGTRIIVSGKPQIREWDRDDGTKGTAREILVNDAGPELRFTNATITGVVRQEPIHDPSLFEDEDGGEF